MRTVFGITPVTFPTEMDWDLYSWVVRASIRKAIVTELGKRKPEFQESWTASRLRRTLSKSYPIGLNPTIDGLAELEDRGVVECNGITKKRGQRCYELSNNGLKIFAQIKEH